MTTNYFGDMSYILAEMHVIHGQEFRGRYATSTSESRTIFVQRNERTVYKKMTYDSQYGMQS